MRFLIVAAILGFAAPALAQTAPAPAAPAEQKICKSQLETGSLVRKRKLCFTRSEWTKIASSQQDGATRLVQDLQGKPGGN